MDSNNQALSNGVAAGIALRRGFKRHKRQCFHDRNIAALTGDQKAMQFQHSLIDYRRNNEVVKRKMMSRGRAWELNQLLTGSGMAWALHTPAK